jgi:BirA family biotin operon repressor/biotin-[acetyl-CoA-carboxylase] ligase
MTEPREVWSLDTRRLGRRVQVFDRLDSTNSRAAALAEDEGNDGVAVLADEQTAGRGQHGRTWLAPPGRSVLLSLLLSPPPELCRPAVLTAWAAVAVCATVRAAVGEQPRIKWPNDVYLRGRKVCGILIESAGRRRSVVVGIGLNVRQSAEEFAAAGLPEATSLAQFTDRPPDTYALAVDLIRRLDDDYDHLCAGDLATLESRWAGYLGLLGEPVLAECPDATHAGRLRELTFGGVVLERPGADPLLLAPERILHLRSGDG